MSIDEEQAQQDTKQAEAELGAMEKRVWRNMLIAVIGAVSGSLLVAPWRVTTGLLLGGLLAFFNYHWLRTALGAIVGRAAQPDVAPKVSPARYVLRYFIIALVVFGATQLRLVSLPATIAGLLAFAAAIMFEGLAQLYFVVAKEEI